MLNQKIANFKQSFFMLFIFCTTILLLVVFSGLGRLSIDLIGSFDRSFSGLVFSGILFCTVLATVFAFFIPLNGWIEAGLLLVGVVSFFKFKVYDLFYESIVKQQLFFAAIFMIICFFGSFSPFILDHFGYYVPTIKWLSEVGLTQGISNLDLVLGQMSFWHILQALFSNFSDPFLRLNSVLLVAYLIYIIEKKVWILLLFLPVLFLFCQSPSPDLAVFIFSLVILNEIFTKNKYFHFVFAFSIFIFCIKPTMIWVPVFAFFYALFYGGNKSSFWLSGSAVLLLFLFKNYWCFGYPIFPVAIGDIGLSYKPHPKILEISSELAIRKTYDMQYTFAEIKAFSKNEAIQNWLFLDGLKSKINLLFVCCILFFGVFAIRSKSRLVQMVFIAVLIKSIAILVFSAQYRFFIDVFFVVGFIAFRNTFVTKFSSPIFGIFTFFAATFFIFPQVLTTYIPSFRVASFMKGFELKQILKPADYQHLKYSKHKIGNLDFFVVKDYSYSFDTPIPAISPEFLKENAEAGVFPQKMGQKLRDGFYWKKMNDQEKASLNVTIQSIKRKK